MMMSFKIDKDLKDKLAELAKEQNRSLSNLIETVLMKFVQGESKDKKPKK